MEAEEEIAKPSILLVEDTMTQALLMQHQLKKAGYTVKLARSGQAAIDEMAKERYQIVLSDINMPNMDGYDLCRAFKSRSEWASVPFVLLATPVEKQEILKMLACGADNFILKAFDEVTFLAKLDEIVCSVRLRESSGPGKTFYNGKETDLASTPPAVAEFLLSAFDMYLFQLAKAGSANPSEAH